MSALTTMSESRVLLRGIRWGRVAAARHFAPPDLSLTEYPDQDRSFRCIGRMAGKKRCDHVARQRIRFSIRTSPREWERLAAVARKRWQAWLEARREAGAAATLATELRADDVRAHSIEDLLRQLEGER